MEKTASTLKAKEQTAPASAAIAEIGPVYIRERSAHHSKSQPQLSQKLSSDASPSWILDAAKEVVASSSCKVGGVSLCARGTTFMVRKLFSSLCGFLAAVVFKGVNALSSWKLKINVNGDWRKEAGRISYKIPMCLISGNTK